MIAIIDYGCGNLLSVENALKRLECEYILTANPAEIIAADKIILPGVGNAAEAMANISDAIQNLLLAADHYTMSQASQSTRTCFNLATLAALQARHPETLVLGLSRDEARRVLAQ